jgi:hypothetical protein
MNQDLREMKFGGADGLPLKEGTAVREWFPNTPTHALRLCLPGAAQYGE